MKNYRYWISWGVLFSVLTGIYCFIFRSIAHSSDEAGPLLSAFEMFHGNPLLRGWAEPASTFYATDLPLSGALTLIFGLSPKIMNIAASVGWSLVVTVSIAVTLWLAEPRKKIEAAIIIGSVLGIPTFYVNQIQTIIASTPTHIVTIAYTLALFAAIGCALTKHRPTGWLVTISLIVAILTMSDPFALYISTIPALSACFFAVGRPRARRALGSAAVVTGLIAGKMLRMAMAAAGGFVATEMPASFVTFDKLPDNVSLIIRGMLGLFGADFFGKPLTNLQAFSSFSEYISSGPLVSIVRIVFVAMACVTVYAYAKTTLKDVISSSQRVSTGDARHAFRSCLIWSILVVLGGNLLSNMPVNILTTRYLTPVWVFATILTASRFPTIRMRRAYIAALTLLPLMACVSGYYLHGRESRYAETQKLMLASWLEAHALIEGYGPYWGSSIVTVLSKNHVKVRPAVIGDDGKIHPFMWLTDTRQFAPANLHSEKLFVLANDNESPPTYGAEHVLKTLGLPLSRERVGAYEVFVYNRQTVLDSDLVPR